MMQPQTASVAATRIQHQNGATQAISPISWAIRIGFVLIPLAHSAGMNIVTLLGFRYLTDNLAISAGLAGIMFAVVKIYDGILDPILGAASDRTRSRWGRRIPYLLAGALLMPLAVMMFFDAPDFRSAVALQGFIVVALMLHSTAYTALTVPGMAMLVEVTDDSTERSTLMSFRVLGNSLGVLAGSTLPAWLLTRWGATHQAHSRMSFVIAGLLLAAGAGAVLLLRRAPQTSPATQAPARRTRPRVIEQFRLAWENRPFRILAITHIFVLIGTAVTSVGNAYFTRYVLRRSDAWLGSYYMIATIAVVASMPLWLRFAKAHGKKASYMIAMGAFGLVHLSWIAAGPGEPVGLLVLRAVIAGIASAGAILFAYSMLSDAIHHDYTVTGLRREGAFAGFTSLIDKLSAAFAIGGIGLFLSRMGYVSSTAGAAATQSAPAMLAITISFTIVPPLAMLLGIATLTRYRLDADTLRARR